MPSPAAIYFSGDGYTTRGAKLMGRQSAGAGFLRALVAASGGATPTALLAHPNEGGQARASFAEAGWTGPLELLGPDGMARLGEIGTLYLPAPGLATHAWSRSRGGERRYSLSGVIHTIATQAVMSQLADLLTAPVRPWDALVCTSQAGRQAVEQVLQAQADYLRWRLGATRIERPQLPVIPLGVHCRDFDFPEAEKAAARQALGVAAEDVVVLFAGRLSFHAKAHPHPMLLALQRCAAARPGRRLHLVQCGQHANDAIAQAFDEAQRTLAPDVVHHHAPGGDAQAWRRAWAAADVFTSLSDNVQETFGLTPIEAMAAGLPVVVSDWDGYRDTVRDGLDGLRVPTTLPPAGDVPELVERYELGLDSYDLYCGQLCELVAVDVEAAEQAYGRLIDDAALRRRLGDSGRERARQTYDWSQVMARYLALWEALAVERRHAAQDFGPAPSAGEPPDRMDPLRMFAGHATQVLSATDRLRPGAVAGPGEVARLAALASHRYARRVLPTEDEVAPLWQRWAEVGGAALTVESLLTGTTADQARRLRRALVWMLKVGLLRRA